MFYIPNEIYTSYKKGEAIKEHPDYTFDCIFYLTPEGESFSKTGHSSVSLEYLKKCKKINRRTVKKLDKALLETCIYIGYLKK